MPTHLKACLATTVLLLWLFALAVRGAAPLAVDIYPRQQMSARGTVRVRMIVERDERNRVLAWTWESPWYSGFSSRQIEGAESQRVWTVWLKDLPPGEYVFAAQLGRNDYATITQTSTFRIIGLE